MNRKRLSVKNATFALVTQFLILVGQFLVQTIFIKFLSAKYLGANGLFTNLVSFLSFSELGIGSAITYSLYEPLANKDYDEVNSIMHLFKNAYRMIGLTILVLGLILSIFINKFVRENQSIPNLRLFFILYLLSTVVSYFYTYTRSLIIADQKGYINSTNQLIFKLLQIVLQIVVLIEFESYFGYLVIMIVTNLASNIRINYLTFQKFEFLDLSSRKKLPKKVVSKMKSNVVGTMSNKIGEIVVFGTDNILISKFVGLFAVGIYSNYSLIVNGITSLTNQVVSALISSFGNLGATSHEDYQEEIFFDYFYLVALGTYALSTIFLVVSQPFMMIWFGKEYVLSNLTVLLITCNFVLTELRQGVLGFISALGLFWPMRFKSLVEGFLNLSISLVLLGQFHLGITAVLLGTFFSTILINMWWEPLVLFHYGFHSSLGRYFLKLFQYLLLIAVTFGMIIFLMPLLIKVRSLILLCVLGVLSLTTSILIFEFCFMNTIENKFFVDLIRKLK